MPVIIEGKNQFRLDSRNMSYVFCILQGKYPAHLYWGRRLPEGLDLTYLVTERMVWRPSFTTQVPGTETYFSDLPLEFSVLGNGDHRTPVFHAAYAGGSTVSDFDFEAYRIIPGKPALPGLPAVYAENEGEASSLEISLRDPLTGMRARLLYTVFEDYDAVTRSIRYENAGKETAELLHPGSLGIDLPGRNYKILHLHGDHMRERQIEYGPVPHGIYTLDSKRGQSSHVQNPFAALLREDGGAWASEYSGEVFGFSLVYSGNFQIAVEGGTAGGTRLVMGINPFSFSWKLKAGESFQTPEGVLVYSAEGLDGMSGRYHRLYRERLCRGKYRDAPRPMVINNWEATGISFTEEKAAAIAQGGAELGLEMFVLDDGWFGRRDRDDSSLGDWYVHKTKLPRGLGGLIERVNGYGMKFGLWFEPEMVSPESDLYRAHPDWCLHAEGRPRSTARNQLVLDLSRGEVRDYLFGAISSTLKSGNIEYVKWDCNRYINETSSREQSHRHVLGVYELMERLVSAFPDILFESCSGGGGRFDPGILYYMPQTWTSDNTDPIDRLRIQYGSSLVYPPISMTAHAGKIETGKKGVNRLLRTCALAALGFNFGFEQDLSALSEDEREQAKEYVAFYRRIRDLVQFGDFHRLENPFVSSTASWMTVSPRRDRAAAFFFQDRKRRNEEVRRVRLRGLDRGRIYRCTGELSFADPRRFPGGRDYSGAELMDLGLLIPDDGYEFAGFAYVFEEARR